jgi:hypothetical protein
VRDDQLQFEAHKTGLMRNLVAGFVVTIWPEAGAGPGNVLFWLVAGSFSDVVSDALAHDDQLYEEAHELSGLYLARVKAVTDF